MSDDDQLDLELLKPGERDALIMGTATLVTALAQYHLCAAKKPLATSYELMRDLIDKIGGVDE